MDTPFSSTKLIIFFLYILKKWINKLKQKNNWWQKIIKMVINFHDSLFILSMFRFIGVDVQNLYSYIEIWW